VTLHNYRLSSTGVGSSLRLHLGVSKLSLNLQYLCLLLLDVEHSQFAVVLKHVD
jgi:hypothetical protein